MRYIKLFKNAFTLAEVMIALVVIGIITSILLPVAYQTVPDENVMKFKKGNATLAKVINELVTSDKYYSNGDLGIKADGNLLSSDNENDIKYFCQTFADVVSTKSVNCSTYKVTVLNNGFYDLRKEYNSNYKPLDETCKNSTNVGEEIVTADGIVYYLTAPNIHFGFILNNDSNLLSEAAKQEGFEPNQYWYSLRMFNANCDTKCPHPDDYIPTKSALYRIFCMDIDGINNGEDPFGYGIRADGKIILGDRAKEWL